MEDKLVHIGSLNIDEYIDKPLFLHTRGGKPTLYKPADRDIIDRRNYKTLIPDLYINYDDVNKKDRKCIPVKERTKVIQDIQKEMNNKLKDSLILINNIPDDSILDSVYKKEIQNTIMRIVEDTLNEPRSGTLEGVADTVSTIACSYMKKPSVLKNLLMIEDKDWNTGVHSTNTMALMLGYCHKTNMPAAKMEQYGLAALLHDVGKADIPTEILQKPGNLTAEEFKIIKTHPMKGYKILSKCKIPKMIAIGAYQHHEKLDGSGYPSGADCISDVGKILGIIDVYEALTSSFRSYREPMRPYAALRLIKEDVDKKKFDKKIFSDFVQSIN